MVQKRFFYYAFIEVRPMDIIRYMTANGADFDLAVIISEMYQ